MIVKNEEDNIERALSWAKGIAFEQIVVDTGSTDRTVELAKKMGAKVHHFEWINDFSAAKNYAMDLAAGDWIAILDADEYITQEDVNELVTVLENIQNDPELFEECDAITCRFIDLDDNGNIASVGSHQRIFRNRPYLRFTGKIHEVIKMHNKFVNASTFRIYHTGYTKSAYKDKDKTERNITMLRNELERDPENPDIMLYLANNILALGTDEAKKEAEEMHLSALASKRPTNTLIKELAYSFLIPRFSANTGYETEKENKEKAIELCNKAIEDLPYNIDYRYYRAVLYNQKGDHKSALEDLQNCEKAFTEGDTLPKTNLLIPSPLPMFYQMTVSTEGLGDKNETIRNSEIINAILTDNKYQADIAGPYIRAMSWYGASDDEVFSKLANVYDLKNPKDMMFIARAAKESGAIDLARKVMETVKEMLE
jgi:glycosyltransferase involved in cell wall biosynthesis